MAENASIPKSCNMKSCYCKDRWAAVKPPATTTCAAVHKKVDGVAAWFLGGFAAAFFASLERCSCINIATKDDLDDGSSSPLIAPGDVISPAADVMYSADRGGVEDHRVVEIIHVD